MASLPQHSPANADSKPYWDAAQEGRLVFKKCSACGHLQFPPRHLCPKCWCEQAQWVESSGRGRVHSFSVVRRAPTPEHAAKVPYVLAIIDLEDGPRMMTNIVGEDALQVAINDAVSVVFEQREGYSIPQFRRRN